jgi:CheY-like chemotaxis protein
MLAGFRTDTETEPGQERHASGTDQTVPANRPNLRPLSPCSNLTTELNHIAISSQLPPAHTALHQGQQSGLVPTQFEGAGSNQSPAAIPQALRVLLLEDEVNLAKAMKQLFDKMGHRPAVAHLGSDALRLLEEQQFHLALVDIDLPDTTGFKVVAEALARGKLQGTKVIFCSGDPSAERVAMASQFPGSLFLPKPFELQKLFRLIRDFSQSHSIHLPQRANP